MNIIQKLRELMAAETRKREEMSTSTTPGAYPSGWDEWNQAKITLRLAAIDSLPALLVVAQAAKEYVSETRCVPEEGTRLGDLADSLQKLNEVKL